MVYGIVSRYAIHNILCPKLVFQKSLYSKICDLFFNWPNEEIFWKSNHMDGKKHYQLA